MKKHLLILFLGIFQSYFSQNLYFPPTTGNLWDTISLNSLGWCENELPTLYNVLDQNNTKAFIVLKDGKIVIEHYFDQFTKDSIWYWASAGKSLTAFLIGIAQQEGNLNINNLSSQYMGTGWTSEPLVKENLITVKNQLTMTTGLDDSNNFDCTDVTCLTYLTDAGTRWSYHNAPYTLLDSVIEGATGSNLTNYVYSKLTPQTGISGLFFKSGYNNVFYSKPRSMARYGLLCLNKGKWGNTPIMTDSVYFNEMTNTSQNLNNSYGYLWWLNGKSSFMLPQSQIVFPGSLHVYAPNDMYSALGKNGQILNVVPSQNLVMIRMGDAPNTNGLITATFNDTIWKYFNNVTCTPLSVEANKKEWNSVTIYPNPFDNIIHINGVQNTVSYQINSLDGKTIESGTTLNSIQTNTLKKGVYFITLNHLESFKTFKIIKN